MRGWKVSVELNSANWIASNQEQIVLLHCCGWWIFGPETRGPNMSSCLGIFFPPRGKVTQQHFFLRGCSAAKRVEGMVHFKAPKIEPKVFCFWPHFEEQTRFIFGTETEVNKGTSFVLAVWVLNWRLFLLQKGYQKDLHVSSKFWRSKRQHF